MPRNVEIKARVQSLDTVKEKAARMAAESGGQAAELKQEDTFFPVAQGGGRLKFRNWSLSDGSKGHELIFYQRSDSQGPKLSDYSLARMADEGEARDLCQVLSAALGLRGVVRKTRWLYLVGQTRVHCDRVESLGDFVELEVVLREGQSEQDGTAIAHKVMAELGVAEADLVSGAYMDHILQKTGQKNAE